MTLDNPDAVLRDEIAQTRSDLGGTIEALLAKADVRARTKDAVNDVTDQAKASVRDGRDQALGVATSVTDRVIDAAAIVGDRVRSNAAAVKDSLADGDVIGAVRKPLPIAGFAITAALVGLIAYLVRRRRA